MAEVNVNFDNFEEEVMKADLPVLLDFWAPWCGPCKMLMPVIEQVAAESEGKAKVCKVNIDDEIILANKFKVTAVPTLIVIKNGEVVEQSTGGKTKAEIFKMLGI
ncbi:MAG: thioredoxin [Lachnospiraceae bacterium]|nr:thioredoxin [Lachnospiraceae bacterium]